MTFVYEGIKYSAIEGKCQDEEGSWYRRYVPDSEMEKWVMEEGKLQVSKQGRIVNISRKPLKRLGLN